MTSTQDLLEALTNHFIKPDDTWAGAVCLTEVTAPNTNRRADLVHIGLWASRGAGGVDVCELKIVAAGQAAQTQAAERTQRRADDLERVAHELLQQAAALKAATPVQGALRSA